MVKVQHQALRQFIKQVNLLGGPQMPINTPDLSPDDVKRLETQLEADRVRAKGNRAQSKPLTIVAHELDSLKRMMRGRIDKKIVRSQVDRSFERRALIDYRDNPEPWLKFLNGSAAQLNKVKPSRQAILWTGANDEVRAALLKSAAQILKEKT